QRRSAAGQLRARAFVGDGDVQVVVALVAQPAHQRREAGLVDAEALVAPLDAEGAVGGRVDGGRAALGDVAAQHGGADHGSSFPVFVVSRGSLCTRVLTSPSPKVISSGSPGRSPCALVTTCPSGRRVRLYPRSS